MQQQCVPVDENARKTYVQEFSSEDVMNFSCTQPAARVFQRRDHTNHSCLFCPGVLIFVSRECSMIIRPRRSVYLPLKTTCYGLQEIRDT